MFLVMMMLSIPYSPYILGLHKFRPNKIITITFFRVAAGCAEKTSHAAYKQERNIS
jgi:hypothetical protein